MPFWYNYGGDNKKRKVILKVGKFIVFNTEDIMKKTFIIAMIFTLALSLFGCVETNKAVSFTMDNEGNYTGFSELPENYTIEQAEKDGCYVKVDLEPVAGQDKWDFFVLAASEGKDAGIRIIDIYDQNTKEQKGPYYIDLFYDGSYYHMFDSISSEQQDKPFLYLLTLNGTLPNAAKDTTVTVLTNDENLTFDEVMWSGLSSSMEYKNSISPFILVMFQ